MFSKFKLHEEDDYIICILTKDTTCTFCYLLLLIFIDKPITDSELLQICTSENEHRSNLFLIHTRDTGGPPKHKQLSKFFGEDLASPGKRGSGSLKKISLFSNDSSSRKSNPFFGERPPDELIVDQLEQFFPNIRNSKHISDDTNQLKNIVQANLNNKRSSKRASSLMLRRQTPQNILGDKERKPTSRARELSDDGDADAPTSVDSNLDNTDTLDSTTNDTLKTATDSAVKEKIPMPISFRWVPGRLIGQGAFGKVFHALNLDSGDFMAVKQVITGQDNTQQKKSSDSLLREIELLSELDHDNIVRYFGKAFHLSLVDYCHRISSWRRQYF